MINDLSKFVVDMCLFAQDYVSDFESSKDKEEYLSMVSYQAACFFAQNTLHGNAGVEGDIIIAELMTITEEQKLLDLIKSKADELGGWKATNRSQS